MEMEKSHLMNHSSQLYFSSMENNRPPYSYRELIIKAFELVKSKPLELRDIYFLISGIFPYYKPGGAWQMAVRHVLCSDPMFSTDPRTNLWHIALNSETKTPQHLFNQSTILNDTRNPYRGYTSLASDSTLPMLETQLDFYKNSENRQLMPFTYNNSVNTVSSYTTSEPRMSSYETSNRWIDSYSGASLQEAVSWPSITNLRSNLSSSLATEQTLPGEICRGYTFFKGHNSGNVVKPNVIRASSGYNYDPLRTFTPMPSSPVDTNIKRFPERILYGDNFMEINPITNQQNNGAFNFYKTQNFSPDCKYSQVLNEQSQTNVSKNYNPQLDCDSPSSLNMAFSSSSKSNHLNSFPESFCPLRYKHISNQLISVNIHATPCSYQTNHKNSLDCSSEINNSLHNSNSLGNAPMAGNNSDRHLESSFNSFSTGTERSSYRNPFVSQKSVIPQCYDMCNTYPSFDSPNLNSVNDFISSLSSLSANISTAQNSLELAAPTDQKRKTNWETSLININIHLSALEKGNKLSTKGSCEKPVPDCLNIASNINAEPYDCEVSNQEVSTALHSFSPALSSSTTKASSEGHDMTMNEVNSLNTTILAEESDSNESEGKITLIKPNPTDVCTSLKAFSSGNTNIEAKNTSSALTTPEASNQSAEFTHCAVSSVDTDDLNLMKNKTIMALASHKAPDEKTELSGNVKATVNTCKALTASEESGKSTQLPVCKVFNINDDFNAKSGSVPTSPEAYDRNPDVIECPNDKNTVITPSVKADTTSSEERVVESNKHSNKLFSTEISNDSCTRVSPNQSPQSNVNDLCNSLEIQNNCYQSVCYESNISSESLLTIKSNQKCLSTDSISSASTVDSVCVSSSIESDSLPFGCNKIYEKISSPDGNSLSPTLNGDKNCDKDSSSPASDSIEQIKHLESSFHQESKLKNEIKPCHVVLERIKLPVPNLNFTSETINTSTIINKATSSNNEEEREDFSNTSIVTGGTESSSSKGSVSNAQTDPIKTQTGAPKKVPHSRSSLPHEINGFVKPSYNYSRLITQVLVTMPQRSATALQICDLIANKYPYFAHLNPDTNWKGSIYSALRTRKKFFTIVGMDEKNEYVWSFNPKFEQFMLDKWVPKFVRNTTLSSSTNSSLPWLPKGHPQNQLRPTLSNQSCVEPTYINTSPPSTSSNSQTPVIEYAGTLISAKPSFPSTDDCSRSSNGNETSNKDPLGPEVTLLDPTPKIQSVSSGGKLFEPWEPEVTVCEGSENDSAKPPPSSSTPQGRESLSTSTVQDKIRGHEDLSLENLHTRHVILKDEISYRVNFNKEHRSIEKFRLHCTVCDEHIGTSGVTCRLKARLHSVLGVLVCLDCYMKTYNNIANTCFWCAKLHSPVVGCHTCDKRFCQVCIERNFGQLWCANIMKKTDWRCFGCDTKQIWPHRAIAYFLFRHYRELKRRRSELMKNKHTSPSELKFYSLDLSTCCRNLEALSRAQQTNRIIAPSLKTTVATTTSTLPQKTVTPVITNNPPVAGSTAPTVTSLPSPQPLFVIGEQPPSYIYVQTPSTASSVTLNTGTQYIHNVYSSPTTSTAQLTTLPTLAVNFPGLIPVPQQVPEINLSKPPEERPPPYSLSKSPPPPYSTINVEVTTNSTSFDKGKKVLANTINKTNIPSSTKVFEIVTSASEDPIIIPDADTPEEFKVREEEVIAVPILSARERIERKPMPKSKKKSLLRTVLMNESIESMKKHLQLQNEPIISSDIKESSVKSASSKGNQNMEEPILKSIIETATERLLSLQKGQTVSSKSGYSSDKTKEVEIVTAASDASIDLATDPLANVPKIKIKTLKELQDPGICNDDQKGQDIFSQPNEAFINENLDVKNKDVTAETSVNITNLKQGIIEASRTLINTQKKFKELAKIISSNLEYKPDKAAELITKFHDILKSCHQELNEIDSNVKEQFEYLTPTTDVDSTLQLLNKQVTDSNTEKKRKKQRKSQIHQKKRLKTTTLNNLQNSESGALESNKSEYSMNNISTGENKIRFPIKKKRDLLDFNPLGRKVILGSPEITEEDLRQIPKTWDSSSQGGWNQNNTSSSHNEVYLEELRRRQYLASKAAWKKKNIWLTSRRKKRKYTKSSLQYNTNSPLMYSEDGTLIKKRHYRKRRRFSDSDDEAVDKTYRPTNPSLYPLRQRRKVSTELSRPLRLSGRMHPSTAAHVARLSSDEDQRDFCDLIKPCSVVLERLDPKVVEILEKRITYLSDSDGSDWEGF